MDRVKYRASTKLLCIALAIILVGSIGASLLQTNFGTVKIKDLYILTSEQQYLHAQAFIPKDASSTNKYPVVITAHGWLNSLEMQDAACIELSRRGCVVIAIDMYGHGLSGSNSETVAGGANGNLPITGLGMIPVVEYCSSGIMDFINTDHIAVMGHSMGAQAAAYTIRYYGSLYNTVIEAAKAENSDGGIEITEEEQIYADSQNKVVAALCTGLSPDSEIMPDYSAIHCNLGFLHGSMEEAGRADTSGSGEAMNVGGTDEVVRFISSVDTSVTNVEMGKFYGDKSNGTLRVMYRPYTTHPLIHFSPACTVDVINFFTTCLNLNTALPASNQLFMLKEICNLVSMIGLFMLLVPLTSVLLSCPYFSGLKGVEGQKIPEIKGSRKKKFWIGWGFNIVIGFVITWFALKVNGPIMGFSGALAVEVFHHPFFSKFFSSPTMNFLTFWTLLMTIWLGLFFWIGYKKDKAAGIRDEKMIGLRITWKELGRSILLAATVIGIVYAIVWLCKWLFNTDFRFWTPAIKTFSPGKLVYFFEYLPVFFAFYLVNSLLVNGTYRLEGMSETKSLLIGAFGNILGCGILWIIQYGCLILNGYVVWDSEWIGVLVLGLCFWQLFLAPFLLRKFYKITGKNWVGAIIVSGIYVLSSVANTYLASSFMV